MYEQTFFLFFFFLLLLLLLFCCCSFLTLGNIFSGTSGPTKLKLGTRMANRLMYYSGIDKEGIW